MNSSSQFLNKVGRIIPGYLWFYFLCLNYKMYPILINYLRFVFHFYKFFGSSQLKNYSSSITGTILVLKFCELLVYLIIKNLNLDEEGKICEADESIFPKVKHLKGKDLTSIVYFYIFLSNLTWEFFLGLPLPLFSRASTFLLISLLVDACTTFSASLSIVFLFFFVGITVSCRVSSSTSVIFRFRTLIELTTLSSLSASDWYSSAFLDLHGLNSIEFVKRFEI
ncbi:hypothetical protein BpHYR1_046835 [Brachionus plicatilis]|uniref:Uncharacterized protein n=1 Tax=Brachionus plicatilis TaxID=10195 RepID=A0A3M7S0A3_BRAPC|nr:hypothetical protein BpHYR1_046835 [Brachionus plicatilis]